MEIPEKTLTPKEAKTLSMEKQITEYILEHPETPNTQIAEEFNISPPTFYNLLKGENIQQALIRRLNQQRHIIDQRLEELWNEQPTNPTNRRTVVKLMTKREEHLAGKIYPQKTEHINLDIKLDLNKLKEANNKYETTIRNLPPSHRKQFWKTYNQLHPTNKTNTDNPNTNPQTNPQQ